MPGISYKRTSNGVNNYFRRLSALKKGLTPLFICRQVNQPHLSGAFGQVNQVIDTEFAENVAAVVLDSPYRTVSQASYFLVAFTIQNEPQDFHLCPAEQFAQKRVAPGISL